MKELKHHGVLGMKWGVRRYQNKDGSLTTLGKQRFGSVNKNDLKSAINEQVESDLSSNATAAAKGSNVLSNASKINKTISDSRIRRKKQKIDLSNMSDKELQNAVNRLNMERNYKNLVAENSTSRGHQYASDVLAIGGSVLAATSSALGIALAIKQLRG